MSVYVEVRFLNPENTTPKITPPKFNIAPEKWWLEDYFPIWNVSFQGRTVKLRGVILEPKQMMLWKRVHSQVR